MGNRRNQSANKGTTKPSLRRLLRDLEEGIKDPYSGIMYVDGGRRPVDGEWINGIRKCDAELALKLLRESCSSS